MSPNQSGRYIGAGPIGRTAEGWPIYLYQGNDFAVRYVTAPPNGTPYYSDAVGRPSKAVVGQVSGASAGALLGGLIGAIGGLGPALLGAAIGAAILGAVSRGSETSK